jgi:hypothetical protein
MSDYDNTNRGGLWRNDSTNPKAPTWKGKIDIDGVTIKLDAWSKVDKAGNEWISIERNTWVPKEGTEQPKATNQPKQSAPVYTPKQHPPMKSALEYKAEEEAARLQDEDLPF